MYVAGKVRPESARLRICTRGTAAPCCGYRTSWGISTRLVGALVMAHGDDSGLIVPP